jgi:nitrite reductase (NO-forming)
VTFTVRDTDVEVAPGVRQTLWTYNGTAPGPILHGRVGDEFDVRVVNHGDMAHSIDFHAGDAVPGQAMRAIPPGGSLIYRFTATHSGAWLYHCSTMPMSLHIANGMFGAVIVDPPDADRVAREFVLVQSEFYLGPQNGIADDAKIRAEHPDAFAFNGYVGQYDRAPLAVRAGERVRVWVVDAGPEFGTSFHVVGTQFDTVFAEGAYLLRPDNPEHGAAQTLALAPGQGGFVEFTLTQPGRYPFVDHAMVDAEDGAQGALVAR